MGTKKSLSLSFAAACLETGELDSLVIVWLYGYKSQHNSVLDIYGTECRVRWFIGGFEDCRA